MYGHCTFYSCKKHRSYYYGFCIYSLFVRIIAHHLFATTETQCATLPVYTSAKRKQSMAVIIFKIVFLILCAMWLKPKTIRALRLTDCFAWYGANNIDTILLLLTKSQICNSVCPNSHCLLLNFHEKFNSMHVDSNQYPACSANNVHLQNSRMGPSIGFIAKK